MLVDVSAGSSMNRRMLLLSFRPLYVDSTPFSLFPFLPTINKTTLNNTSRLFSIVLKNACAYEDLNSSGTCNLYVHPIFVGNLTILTDCPHSLLRGARWVSNSELAAYFIQTHLEGRHFPKGSNFLCNWMSAQLAALEIISLLPVDQADKIRRVLLDCFVLIWFVCREASSNYAISSSSSPEDATLFRPYWPYFPDRRTPGKARFCAVRVGRQVEIFLT